MDGWQRFQDGGSPDNQGDYIEPPPAPGGTISPPPSVAPPPAALPPEPNPTPSAPPPPPGFSLAPVGHPGQEGVPPPPPGFAPPTPVNHVPPPPPGFGPPQPVAHEAAPQWTEAKPLVPKTQGDIDAAPPGAWIKDPTSGDLYQKPAPEAAAAPAPAPLDFSGLNPGPKGPTATGAFLHGAERGALPAAAGIASFAPGFEAGAALGAAVGGPFAEITAPVGGLIGGAITGFGGSWVAQKAQEKGLSMLPKGAQEAIGQSPEQQQAEAAAHPYAAELGGFAPNLLAFRPGAVPEAVEGAGRLGRALAHPITGRAVPAAIMGTQEAATEKASGQPYDPLAIGLAGATGAFLNHPTTLGEHLMAPGALVGRMFGAGVPPPGAPPGTAPPETPSPTPGAPPAGGPAVGETFGMDVGRGEVEPVTVAGYTAAGDVMLHDADGNTHPMAPADVARLRTPLPTGEANAAPPEAAGAPPAAEAPPAEGAAGPAVPPAAAQAPREEPPVSYEIAGEGQPATLEDLENVAAQERAAAAGAPTAPGPALATAEKTLAAEARGEPVEPQPAAPPEPVPQPPEIAVPPEAASEAGVAPPPIASEATPAAPAPASEVTAASPPADAYQRAVELLQSRGVGQRVNAGILRSQLGLSLPDTRALIDRLAADGYLDAGTPGGRSGRNLVIKEPGATNGEAQTLPAETGGPESVEPTRLAVPEEAAPPPGPTAEQIERLRNLEIENAQPEGGGTFFQRKAEEMAAAPEGAQPETESATEPEPAPAEAAAPTAPTEPRVPMQADIDRGAEQVFSAYQQGGPDAARAAYAKLAEGWTPDAVERVRAGFQRLVEASGKPWEAAQQEAGNRARVIEGTHTKTGAPIVTVQLAQKVGTDEFKRLGTEARKLGGYYSSFRGRGALPGFIFKTREAADQFAAMAEGKAPEAAPPSVPVVAQQEAPLAEGEHPGLVVKSLETGKVTHIQPPGTRAPSNWTEIGKNHLGQTLYEDQRGVRSVVDNGIRRTEPVELRPARGGTQTIVRSPEYKEPEFQVAEPSPANPNQVPEYQIPWSETPEGRATTQIGEQIAQARGQTETEPTAAQTEAGNYAKGKVSYHGIPFVMENPEGSIRRGVDENGQPWESRLPADYGYISRTEGADGDHVDAYIGPDHASQQAFVIDQFHPGDGFDEHKVMLGFDSWPQARQAYLDAFSDGSGEHRLGNATPMSFDSLKAWLKEGDTQNPIGQAGLPFAERPAPTEHTPAIARTSENPQIIIADEIASRLVRNEPMTAADVQRIAEEAYGGTLASGRFNRADLYDAMELGVNRMIRLHPDAYDPRAALDQAKQIAESLAELKRGLPTQTVRTGEKESMQQFSTPPDYAYAAAWAANIGRDDSVLEPSAGTGSLAVMAMNARPREVTVNELSANRAPLVESLGGSNTRAFRENAEQLSNVLPENVKPTVVVMNPPFSSAGERMAGRRQIGIGAQHVEEALKTLAPGGRLVAIVGRGMGQNMTAAYRQGTGAAFAPWWQRIGREYDVRANIGVPGDVYTKYGTSFGTRLLVIDKNPPSGRPPVIAEATGIPDLMDRLSEVRDDRQPAREPAGQPVAAEPGREAAPAGGAGAARSRPPLPRPVAEPGVRAEPGSAGPGTELPPRAGTGEPGTAGPAPEPGAGHALVHEQPERPVASGAERLAEAEPGTSVELVARGAGPDGVVLRPEGSAGSVLPASESQGLDRSAVVRVDEAAAGPQGGGVTEDVYENYRPQRITIAGAQPHPGKLVQSSAMASVMPPETTYAPRLPKSLIDSGALSDAQLETITYAGHAHSQMLPVAEGETPYRRGYFVGDGTGVGKGREAAGILLDNWAQGRRKAIWLSEKKTLIKDAQRDWSGLGQDPKRIFDLGKTKPGGNLASADGIAFATYDTLKGAERLGKDEAGKTVKGQSRVDQLLNWFGKDFDGVIVFDESHNLANSMMVKGDRGVRDAAQKALAGIELQKKLPNARVVYVSATGATEVSNLAYAERLGLWGRGSAFPNKESFISQIGSGGIAAMELVARDMKAMGHYTARSLSYDGVEYDRLEHPLTPDQRQTYDALAEAWQVTLNNFEKALEITGPDRQEGGAKSKQARSAALSAFWGAHQRFFNQIITAMQMPSVLRAVEGDLKEGRQAVLQLVNTNEASQRRAIAKLGEEDELEDLDMTPRDQLMQLVEHSFPVAQHEAYVDENGNERTRPVRDAAGDIVENREAVRMREELMEKLGSIRVPDGPLEMLINHFGPDKVAEVTGRKQRIVRKPDAKGQMRTQIEARPGSANVTEADAFQNGKKPILVFSEAGGTGRSYHADNTAPSRDARRSHYLVQAGWRADKAIQGFGRTHRTNQASAPIFHLVTTDLQGQRRFISSIARRLAQLGALTKGERRAGEQGMFSARDNLESTEAGEALYSFFRDLHNRQVPEITEAEFQRQTGLKLTDDNGNLRKDLPPITQFLNRLLSLKFDMQNSVFGAFEDRLGDAIDRASANGTLDVGTETLRGERITKEDERTVHVDPQSGAETKYVRLKVENRNHPARFDQISNGQVLLGGQKPKYYAENLQNGRFYAVAEARSVTDRDGRIVAQYRLADPLKWRFTDQSNIDGYGADKRWRLVDNEAEARQIWDRKVSEIPEYRSEDVHLITGAVLPIWDRLAGSPKIYRTATQSGERLLGRVVDENHIAGVLRALGAEDAMRKYEPSEVAERVLDGDRATLANGWTLKRSTVAGEPRIELTGPGWNDRDQLRADGVFSERIGYDTRYFVPTGADAEKVLSRILERRPVTDFAGASISGIAEGESPRSTAATSRDTLDDYYAHAANYAATPEGRSAAAIDYVLSEGERTGNEHLAVFAPNRGEVVAAGTSDQPDRVGFDTPGLRDRLNDPDAALVIHHNHPLNRALSGADIATLGYPGAGTVVAHGPEGDIFGASLTPEAKAGFARAVGDPGSLSAGRMPYQAADRVVRSALMMQVLGDKVEPDVADRLQADMVNRALDAAGLTNYVSTRGNDDLPPQVSRSIIARAAREAQDAMAVSHRTAGLKGDINARLDRSTVVFQPDEAMDRLSGVAGPGGPERPGDTAAEAGGAGRIGAPGQGNEAVVDAGLREEPSDFGTGAADEAVKEAGEPEDTPQYFARLGADLGVTRSAPGHGDHFFNILNKDFTFPRSKASLDPRSSAKWQAELAKKRMAATLVDGYHDGLASWTGKPAAAWRKVFAAMEILTLEGRKVPLDGRAIIAENSRFPFAAHSKMGETVRLTTPDEIKMFTDYRNTMDKVWRDLVGETARQFGWQGEPSSAAIYKAAEEAGTETREGKRLRRAASLVAAIEYQHRDAYLPLMRSGDYFLRVKPKAGTPDKPGVLGWTGDGFPPTAMYRLIDSMTPFERAVGGMRRGTPANAAAAIKELRQSFPENEYDIDHGYAFRSADELRDLDIPAIEKLMMLVSNDVRGQMAGRLEHGGFSKSDAREAAQGDYDKLVDTVLDKLYEERVAGFKRKRLGTPGYGSDFAASTGKYVNWLSSHIADLQHRPAIEAADEQIARHPDPRTRAFWRDWDRRQEDYGNQMNGPLMRLRQGAFYWMLGGNAATTAKIMLHGPLRGVPMLTTGLGSVGRARAAGAYLAASKDMLKGLRIGRNGIEVDVASGARDAAERALVADAERQGVIHPQTTEEMRAVRHQGEEALSPRARGIRRFLDIWSSNVSAADRMTRGAMLLSAYRTARDQGMGAVNRVWDRDLNWRDNPERTPAGFAKFMVDQTVGVWGDINRMPFMRSQLGGMLGQFRQYELGYLSNLHQMLTRMGPEGKVTAAMMLGGLGMMGGLVALPFFQDAAQAGQWAYGLVSGVTPDWQDDLRDSIDWLFPGAGETVLHGARPLGIDWSGIGFGDLIGRNAQSPLDFLGAAGSTAIGTPARAIQRERSGQSNLSAIAELAPNAVKHMMQALYPEISLYSASGATKISKEPSEGDRIRMGLGFQLGSRAQHFEQTEEAYHRGANYRQALSTVENRIANLHDRGEPINEALGDAQRLIAEGERSGAFSAHEGAQLRRDLMYKMRQRANPAAGTPTMQRMQAIQRAQ